MGSDATVLNKAQIRSTFLPEARSMRRADHRFYTAMAFAMSAGVFAGFFRSYFASHYFPGPTLPFWVHVHGAVFSAWILLYLLQNLLAMNGGMKLHRKLGIVAVVLAPAVTFFGLAITIRQVRQGRFFPFSDSYSTLAVSTGQMILFAVLVGAGLLLRKDGETHKRLMLMAPQLFFFPAFGRLLEGVNPTTLILAMCFYLAGPTYDLITRSRVHGAYKAGVPMLILTMPPFGVIASHSPLWRHFADWVIR